jgi:hypothetical protein
VKEISEMKSLRINRDLWTRLQSIRVYLSKSREGWRTTYREYEYALTPDGVNRDA